MTDAAFSYYPMTIEAYDAVYALWDGAPGIGLSDADSPERIAAYLERNPGQSFVCRAGEAVAGAILCGNDGRRAYIHHAAVAKEHRRMGVATELVRLALEAQKTLGIDKCHLFVREGNEAGQAFWRELGFEARQDISIMSREI